ncbi:2-oxo acid dehydrogenase subunit E2 [Mycolicibacterium smegmatis]|uniref:dihydrolipoamide acetyltransferase family protein n=1 Tax=Mycolicibacterium smegmatis TaxID=1772 RepID=UPI0005D86293|nr:dihydrolipoamide acetyltransferase family protein [Mycolicibacterium smegmatis]MDF1897496.1 dihydrolipoamide acetyltransferase family protein [Mycolicibacterium smegmatis]MDF1904061.1 dihydrolipoamide acetyltransferase family protein [Mycolicibacterium smegmatis]MDF1917062.1 dihydrolipoamide acetyltransferase family protein [Mycolicibacterium smegmatis]MDF1922436.1 dihydrolipoamide acetyltransferase family protein [Mycolicibacterium smegmatis]UAK56331.1 2-oxo acid dehydrogenase subunit E2 [
MSTRDFLVPDLGEGLQDATITSWNVDVGDTVELNQTLCTVETNKAEVEIPSPYAGKVEALGGAAGDILAVGSLLVRIATSSDEPVEAHPGAHSRNGEAAQRKSVLVGYGADDSMDASRRRTHGPRARAKPPVRKLAADLGVDLGALGAGSGPDGIITRDDVLAAAGRSPAAYSAGTAQPSQTRDVRGVQAEMARRMALSRREIPDAHARVDVDCTALLRLRDRIRDAEPDLPVTPFVLTLRLLTVALRRHEVLNATWMETTGGPQIHQHSAVHLGIGVAAPRGLLVPVVRDAQGMTTRQLAVTVARLVESARAGTLSPAELTGSTFTVSNFGALGVDDGVPVINYPEAAILGMGSLRERPVVVDGAVVARPTMSLTCVFDHRIADGAQAAAFLGELRGLIEEPDLALLDL